MRVLAASLALLVSTPSMAQTTTNCTADIYGQPQYGVTCKTKSDQSQVQPDPNAFMRGYNTAKQIADDYNQSRAQAVQSQIKPYGLGIQGQALTDSPTADNPGGFMVTAVAEGSPAQLAGIRPMMTITYINGRHINTLAEAVAAIQSGYGTTFPVRFLNEYGEQTVSITLGADGSWDQ